MNQRIAAIIQARMNSSRLPGKVLRDIAGQPMLARVAARAARASTLDEVWVATTTDVSDDPLEPVCEELEIPLFRGAQFDVLDRFYQAARLAEADVVVRLTADCPLIDPGEIDRVVTAFLESGADFAANRLPPPFSRTTPIGLDTEVCSYAALDRAWREASEPFEREHVMPYLYDQPGRFHVLLADLEADYSGYRWTVDTPQDLELIQRIYAHFPSRDDFGWREVLALVQAHPELAEINQGVAHKELKDVDRRYPG